mmetsp:Transcript_35995/g.55289  ORF Transcript_35995/g.55289 Transcript_35995/m.55289 type:complete len:140 (-) Transcript_35995:1052-1471(-)
MQWKFESEEQGTFKIKFSNSGKYLAAACTRANNQTVIKIFDVEVEQDNLLLVLSGHNDLVHDICWHWDDNFLVTASANGTAKVWNLMEKHEGSTDNLKFWQNDNLFFMGEMYHPSFVYGAKFHPIRKEGFLYIATICYD